MAAQTSSSTTCFNFTSILFREIHKNAWLKRVSSSSVKKKKEKFWVVFCVHDDSEAFLETYIDNKIAVLHKPDWFIYLNDIQHISPTICPQDEEYEFVLTLKNDVVKLTAPTWDQMLDWVASLQSKLHELRILSPKDNVYTRLPENRGPLLSTRDPNSPLPPPPTEINEILPGVENLQIHARTTDSQNSSPMRVLRSNSSTSEENHSSASLQHFNFNNVAEIATASPTTSHYERLFQLENAPGPSTRQLESNSSPNGILQQPPTPYKTFREQQVSQLLKQMKHCAGVRLQLRKKDCINSIALVDAFDAVWVCGWKQKEHPMLYNALHIGDKIQSIAGISVKSSSEAYRVINSHFSRLYVDIIIKRLPHGQIYLIHRETDGQDLGIVQENNTAVIDTVQMNSLAARHGLTAKAPTCDGLSLTNWVITEINSRPLNLFYKKSEVRDRLNSVGKDISILVQPLDLIKQLKKELKSLRNYKDYILE